MARVRMNLARRALAHTIWAPGLFGSPPARYAPLYRVLLPVFDFSVGVAGGAAIIFGSPALVDISDGIRTFSLSWGAWTVLAAALAFAGVTRPGLPLLVEAIGKSAIAASAAVYLGALIVLSSNEGATTRFVATGMSLATLLVAAWRLGDLRTERQRRSWIREHPDPQP